MDDLAQRTSDLLRARGETLAVAETSAGGALMAILSDVVGASSWFKGGIVAYTNESKVQLLHVTQETLTSRGAVSSAVCLEMAIGAKQAFGATWGLAETGIAGPQTGRRSGKPVGLIHVAIVGDGDIHHCLELALPKSDDRPAMKVAFARAALVLLIEALAHNQRSHLT